MSDYFDEDNDDFEELERMKKEMLDEEAKAEAEDQAHQEESKTTDDNASDKKSHSRDDPSRIEFAEITCPGCTYKETKPLDPPMFYTEFEQWKSKFLCPDCGSTSCNITEKEYKPCGLSKMELEINFREFRDTSYYLINIKPIKYILAVKGLNHLVEAQIAVSIKDNFIKYNVNHNKIFLTCIPTKISRHRNPISILKSVQKYSMSFVDQNEEKLSFKHMTLAGILSELKNLGYVIGDGADHALGSMIRAFIDNKSIVDNEDTSYIGFFTDDDNKRIIASNLEIVDPDPVKLNDALVFLEELTPYYEGRLDLLAELVLWGAFAPLNFMLKSENYFLKWLHLHGSSNASKTSSGKIILAMDGHHEDPKYLLNIGNIDTLPRFGAAISKTTFPILVDEVDLNGEKMLFLLNNFKSAIDHKILRSKYPNSQAYSTEDIPSMSPLIETSNSSPPNDDAYMRRIIDRSFPRSESKKEDDPDAIKFREFLRTDLKRFKALGDFRNWYIVNHQAEILDDRRPPPLDLGYNILKEAYKMVDKEAPEWTGYRVPENQLEESMEDSGTVVRRALEKYINSEYSRNLTLFKSKDPTRTDYPDSVIERISELVGSDLLPDIKYNYKSLEYLITKGILIELYNLGVARDQCPNLRALADYMDGEFRKSHGKKVAAIYHAKMGYYFSEDLGND